jgi:hypothetical protein
MAQIQKGTVYSNVNSTVTVDNLNAHVDAALLLPGAISEQVSMAGNAAPAADQTLILTNGLLRKATIVQALGGITPSQLLNANNNLSDLQSVATAKTNLSLNNVENKSSETIRSEITSSNVTTALTYVPTSPATLSTSLASRIATSQLGALNGVATLGGDGKLSSNQVAALTTASQLALIGTSALPAIGAQAFLSATSTGTGSAVLSSGPALVSAQLAAPLFTSPVLGTPVSGNLSNCTNLNLNSVTGTLAITNGGTGATTATGTGSVVLATSPTLTAPVLGTPASGNLSNCTNIPLSAVTGTLATTVGGTGQTTYANGELLIGNSSGGLSKATLTAGSNVSITNASGAITVDATIPAATTAQLGGIIPGPGFTISSGQLNAILPRAIASFDGQFATTTQVTASYSKTGSTVTITYDFSGGKPQLYTNNKAYFIFTKASGAGTVPTSDIYQVLSVTTSGNVQTITTTSATAGDSAGSVTFRYCVVNNSQNIGSIIYTANTANAASYLVNFTIQFQNTFFIPNVSLCAIISTTNPADNLTRVVIMDYNDITSSNTIPRTTSCFTFTSWAPNVGNKDTGYASGIFVFGS